MTKKKDKPTPPSKQMCSVLKFIIEKRKEDYMWRYHNWSINDKFIMNCF